jgi:hypothetical protein
MNKTYKKQHPWSLEPGGENMTVFFVSGYSQSCRNIQNVDVYFPPMEEEYGPIEKYIVFNEDGTFEEKIYVPKPIIEKPVVNKKEPIKRAKPLI